MKRYGLIGFPLSHSFSKGYFSTKFAQLGENAVYENIEVAELNDIHKVIQEFDGLNVTIPYKKAIIPYLDKLSDTAKAIGAVNVIQRIDDKWIGHNSDQYGFEKSLLNELEVGLPKQALIFGTGGAAAAVKFTLKKLGISYFSVSRNPEVDGELSYAEVSPEVLKNSLLLINTTPLGMGALQDKCAPIAYECLTKSHFCFDLIYNPEETLFLKKAKSQGAQTKNGLEMLHLQAEKAWQIWNSSSIDANSSL